MPLVSSPAGRAAVVGPGPAYVPEWSPARLSAAAPSAHPRPALNCPVGLSYVVTEAPSPGHPDARRELSPLTWASQGEPSKTPRSSFTRHCSNEQLVTSATRVRD